MALHMVSMKRKSGGDSPFLEEDFFPHSMFLQDEEIEKLGLTGVEVGQEIVMMAMVKVTSVSVREDSDNKKFTSMDLTITEAAIGDEEKSLAKRIFSEA